MAQFVPEEVLALKVKVEDLPAAFQKQLGTDPALLRSEAETKEVAGQIQEASERQLEQGGPSEQQQ